MLIILSLLSISISRVFSSCAGSGWVVDYSSDKCWKSNGVYTMYCPEKWNTGTCGMRLSYTPKLGRGAYSAKIKAAPGAGMNTAFYLFSYGRYNDKSYAWNEIDVEILGNLISNGKTKIWTNVWTGYYTQHYEMVEVPWDASTGYHTYKITINKSKIKWIFDGKTYRTFTYTGYSDLKSTIENLDFQGNMALWSSTDGSWSEMGGVYNNNNNWPLYGYFKSVTMTKWASYTEEEEDFGGLTTTGFAAIMVLATCFICCLIGGGVYYYKRRKKRLRGDGASFKDEEEEDGKDKIDGDTPTGNTPGDEEDVMKDTPLTPTSGYDMEPINTEEIEVEIEMETQA